MQSSAWKPSLADRMAHRHFRKHLPKAHRRTFDRDVAAMLEADENFAPDRVTFGHLAFAFCVMSSVDQWQNSGLTRPEAKENVRKAVLTFGRTGSAIAMWLTAKLSRDPFQAIGRYSEDKANNGYGPTFDIKHETIENGFASVVHQCGYRTILERHGADDLIDLFCIWDRVWIDALPKGIGFDRPTTLAEGDSSCRFEFKRQ